MAYKHVKAWRHRNPDLVRQQSGQYGRLKRGPRGLLLKRVLAAYGEACLRCGQVRRLCADHVVPLTLGGVNAVGNIQPLCRPCNTVRGKSADERTRDYRPDQGARIEGIKKGWEAEMRDSGRWNRLRREEEREGIAFAVPEKKRRQCKARLELAPNGKPNGGFGFYRTRRSSRAPIDP